MKMKPLMSGGRKEAARSHAREEDPAMSWKEKKVQKRRQKEDRIDQALLDTDVKLRLLKDRYRLILEKELRVARAEKARGKKNSATYSKIGVAYYSLGVVDAAQERLREMSSSRELFHCMNEMSAALSTINGLSGKIGKLDPKGMVKGMRKMSDKESGASRDLLKTLSVLSGLETSSEDSVPIDTLVSVDVIEKLINGEDVDNCIDDGAGVGIEAGELLDLFSGLPEVNGTSEEETGSLDEIEAATQNIAHLLDQL